MLLSTADECIRAISYAKTFDSRARMYKTEVFWPAWPKGCVIDTSDNGNMYFNKHATGGRQGAIPICRKGNT